MPARIILFSEYSVSKDADAYFLIMRIAVLQVCIKFNDMQMCSWVFDGWIDDLRFYVLFNSISVNQDDGRMIMKSCVQWNPVYG